LLVRGNFKKSFALGETHPPPKFIDTVWGKGPTIEGEGKGEEVGRGPERREERKYEGREGLEDRT